jgi:hypothetical protein
MRSEEKEFFIARAVRLMKYYDTMKQIRGEDDGLVEFILKTAQLNKRIADCL